MARPLSSTHFGLLALLAARPMSAYALVKQMDRSIGQVWPRARSNLYADVKALAEAGLATAESGRVGRRPRTTYRITAAGRTALAAWLAEPGDPPAWECEALLKLAFAPDTTRDAVLAQIEVIERYADERLALGGRLGRAYVDDPDDPALFPERLHVNALMFRYLWGHHRALQEWARWARAEVERWDDTSDSPAKRGRGLRSLAETLEA